MRATTVLLVLIVMVLWGGPARADEPTFLERLNVETQRLVEMARQASVTVTAGRTTSQGVLVGARPLLVVRTVGLCDAEDVRFRLASGAEGTATRIDGDRELGVAVYALPDGVAEPERGLAVDARWEIPRGELAVLFGETSDRLLLLGGTPGPRDGFRVGDEAQTGVLLGVGGRLLGLRPTVSSTATSSVSGYYNNLYDLSLALQHGVREQFFLDTWRRLGALQRGRAPGRPATPSEAARAAAIAALGGPKGERVLHVTPRLLASPPAPPPGGVLSAGTFVPGALVARVLDDVERHGRIRHAYLGVVPGDAEGGRGASLVTVVAGSPARDAGLAEGEIVTAVNGHGVEDATAFSRALLLHRPGETLTLTVAGRSEPVAVVLADRADAQARLVTPESLGMEVMPLSPQVARFLGVAEDQQGVAVVKVEAGGLAAAAGLARGDVLVEGDGLPIRDVGELLAALAGANGQLALVVLRRENARFEAVLGLTAPDDVPAPR